MISKIIENNKKYLSFGKVRIKYGRVSLIKILQNQTKKLEQEIRKLEEVNITKIEKEDCCEIQKPIAIYDVSIGRGSYVAQGSIITMTDIGRFCSIGPNLVCGYGIHPTNGISTSPAFYST